jgi:peptide/nickel transport system substrate-binding protein
MRVSRDPKDRNAPLVYHPDLADSWETADPLKITFKVRQDVKWHNIAPVNGRAMTAEDIKFALERCANDKASLFRGNLSAMKSVETPDAGTLVINLKQFDPLLFGGLANQGPWVTPKELADSGHMKDQIIGTGPFVFQQWEQDVRVHFKKNPDYFIKGVPFVDELNILQIKDENARTAAFQSGQTAMGDIPFNAYEQFKSNRDITIEPYLRVQPYVLYFNFKEPRWKDDRVRQAVAVSIDTDIMVKALVGEGLWRGIVSNQHGGWTLSQDELKSAKYFKKQDLARAKQLMSAAGNPDGLADVELLYNTQYPQEYQDGMQYMTEVLTKNKIAAVKPVGKDQATMRKQQDEHTYNGLVFGPDGQGFPELYLIDYRTGGPKNGSGLSDPEVDADVNKVLAIVDVRERQVATKAFIDKYLQRVMYKHEFVDGTFYEGWHKDTHNYVPFPPFQYTSAHPFVWLGEA